MSEAEQQARLAALGARRGQAPPAMDQAPAAEPQLATPRRAVTVGVPSTARICATAASTVSFAAMVVAMGPLVAAETDGENDFAPEEVVADTVTTPAAPSATISLAQQKQPSPANLTVGSSTTAAPSQPLPPAAEATPESRPAHTTAAPPTTPAPPTTATPVTQPPPPPPTAAPKTAPPAPPTAPPPPKSGASG